MHHSGRNCATSPIQSPSFVRSARIAAIPRRDGNFQGSRHRHTTWCSCKSGTTCLPRKPLPPVKRTRTQSGECRRIEVRKCPVFLRNHDRLHWPAEAERRIIVTDTAIGARHEHFTHVIV